MKVSDWHNLLNKITSDNKNNLLVSVLRQTKPQSATDTEIILECENQGVEIFLRKRSADIDATISKYLGKNTSLVFVQKQKKESEPPVPLLQYTPTSEDYIRKAGLNPKHKFDNFAVFSTNQIAYAAAQAIAQNPGTAYNPFFIWGGVGVGKTHLAQSIARVVIEADHDKKIYFCPGDQFTNELVEAIREKSTPRFRRKYRDLDFLIIDDVQFIAGKVSVQEELFHTFNAIVSRNGQIILTSDKPPFEIKSIEDRLRSRFSGGLIVDIQPPDFELRTAILLIKAKEKNLTLDIEAAKVIAEQIVDTRALEGCLLSIGAKIWGKKDRIDLEVVADYFSDQKTPERNVKKIQPADVIRAVANYYDVKASHIRGSERTENLAMARQITMYLLREEIRLKLEEIAFILKKKDHTTVIHGVNKIKATLMKDVDLKKQIDTIIQTLRQ